MALLGLSTHASASVVGCSAELDAYIWNLNKLRRSPEDGDYQVTFTNADGPQTLAFNLCSNTKRKCLLATEAADDGDDDFGNLQFTNGTCHRLSEDDMDESVASYIDPQVPEYGLRLKFTSTEVCQGTEFYGYTLDIRCDKDAKLIIPRVVSDSVTKNSCNPRLYLESEAGCVNKSFNKVWKFFEDLVDEFGVALILIGLFLTFFGAKYQKGTLFISGFIGATIIALVIIYGGIMPSYAPDWAHMVAFFLAVLGGMVVGLLASMFVKAGMFGLGAWMGATSGIMLYDAVFSQAFGDGDAATAGFWIVIIICMILGAIIILYLFQHAIAIASSLCGAYALVRVTITSYLFIQGAGIFIGGFPNEYLVYQEISNGSYASMPDEFYIYLGVYIFLAILGFCIQEREFLKDKINEKILKKPKKATKKGENGEEELTEDEEQKHDDEEPLVKRDKKNRK